MPVRDQATRLRALVAALGEPEPPSPATPESRTPVIAIASGKGGVGKTTLSVNLSVALAQLGVRTTLIDADLGTANADVLCGMMPRRRIEEAVGGAASLDQIAVNAPGGFRLVPGSSGIGRMASLEPAQRRALAERVLALRNDSDVLLIDTGAGIGVDVTTFLSRADLALIVTGPEPTAITDAYALIKCLVKQSDRRSGIGLIVNNARDGEDASGVHERMARAARHFLGHDLPLTGWIAHDLRVGEAVRQRKPLLLSSPRSPAAVGVRSLADRLAESMQLLDDKAVVAGRRKRSPLRFLGIRTSK